MDATRPLAAVLAGAIALGVVGALVTLVTGTVIRDGAVHAPALGALVVVVLAVAAAVAAGRRSSDWVANAESYW